MNRKAVLKFLNRYVNVLILLKHPHFHIVILAGCCTFVQPFIRKRANYV